VVSWRRAGAMACALRLAQLIDEHNASGVDESLEGNIYVLEKSREWGSTVCRWLARSRSMKNCCGFREGAPLVPSHEGSCGF